MADKRYFYTQHHHAACMAIDFGIAFQIDDADKPVPSDDYCLKFYTIPPCVHWRWPDGKLKGLPMGSCPLKGSEKLYIHPDSLHLLEPINGDLLELGEGQPEQCGYSVLSNLMYAQGVRTGEEWLQGVRGSYPIRIIQRGGKPFFWPESE